MMKPGRELDALVAEKVMGWVPWDWTTGDLDAAPGVTYFAVDGGGFVAYDRGALAIYDSTSEDVIYWFSPSTDIAAAWLVVEYFNRSRTGYFVEISDYNQSRRWFVDIGRGHGSAHADTIPHAICLAALRAVGVKV